MNDVMSARLRMASNWSIAVSALTIIAGFLAIARPLVAVGRRRVVGNPARYLFPTLRGWR